MRTLLLAAVLCAGCLRSTQFKCDANTDCGALGRCEAAGYCSVADASCPGTMQRFSDSAGPLAGMCVAPAGGGVDAGTDPPVDAAIDAPRDAPREPCPGSYRTIEGGTPGHVYRRLPSARTWEEQRADCAAAAPRTYIAIPDNAAELAAVSQLNGNNKLWLGISDLATEGAFVTVTGGAQTFLPWKQGSPNPSNDNDRDCVAADSATEIIDDECDQEYEVVCECEE